MPPCLPRRGSACGIRLANATLKTAPSNRQVRYHVACGGGRANILHKQIRGRCRSGADGSARWMPKKPLRKVRSARIVAEARGVLRTHDCEEGTMASDGTMARYIHVVACFCCCSRVVHIWPFLLFKTGTISGGVAPTAGRTKSTHVCGCYGSLLKPCTGLIIIIDRLRPARQPGKAAPKRCSKNI